MVTWDRLAGATSYLLSYTATGGIIVSVDVGDATSHTLTNLKMNTSYTITVQGCVGDEKKSNPSTSISVLTTGKWFITIIIS